MPLLALNTVSLQSMRVKYQIAIGVLPIGLMFASLLPLGKVVNWLESHFGIPMNNPINDHPNSGAWIAIILSTMIALMLLGYAFGWFLNAAISSYVLGWSTEKVLAVYLQSKLPADWLKEGPTSSPSADAAAIAKWEAQRKVGAIRFIAVRGVLAWGVPMLLAMHLIPTITMAQAITMERTLLNLALWAGGGAIFGVIIWHSSEANYRKLKQRNETQPLAQADRPRQAM